MAFDYLNQKPQLDKNNVRLSKAMYESKLLDMDKQLASSIQTQVVETSRALELLKLSYNDIKGIHKNFQQIDDKCLKCKKYLKQFDQIKKLSLARNNLHITTKIGKLFSEVPKKAKQLLNLLEDNPDKYLYYVYKNLRKLVKLRDETLNKGLIYMDDNNDNNKEEQMKNHFKLIDRVILNLEKQVRMNICDALYLAVKQPETLVETLKICESEDRTNKKNKILCYSINDWSKWRDKEQIEQEDMNEELDGIPDTAPDIEQDDDEEVIAPKPNNDTMCDKVKSEILSSIIGLTEHLQAEKEKNIKEFLKAIDENMKDLDYVNEYLRLTFPPSYEIVKYYISTYYKFLQPLILAQLDADNVPTQERLFVVSWIAKFKMSINNLEKDMNKYGDGLNNKSSSSSSSSSHRVIDDMINNLSDQEEALLASYIKTCREKLSSWITNIVENESKKQEHFMVDNIPRTHCPQDLFTALNHQFTIATQQLRGTPFVNVILMILKSMDKFKTLLNKHILDNNLSFDDEYFCAMLNSCYDVSQKLKDKSDKILDQPDLYNINDKQITKLDDSFDDRICLFTNMGKECSTLLAVKVYKDTLKENIFNILFTDKYFDTKPEDNEYIQSMILTIGEYFDDFKQWIEESYFYWEVVKGIINIITSNYIEALLLNKPNCDPEDLAYFIREDIKSLNEYFGNKDEFGDVKKLWTERSKILDAIPASLECEDGFFESIAKPLVDNASYGEKLLKYIEKLRKKNSKKYSVNYGSDEDDDDGGGGNNGDNKMKNKLKARWKKISKMND